MCKEMKMQIERSRKCIRRLDEKGISEKHFISGQGKGFSLLKGVAAGLLIDQNEIKNLKVIAGGL
jgi:hypothetical protein